MEWLQPWKGHWKIADIGHRVPVYLHCLESLKVTYGSTASFLSLFSPSPFGHNLIWGKSSVVILIFLLWPLISFTMTGGMDSLQGLQLRDASITLWSYTCCPLRCHPASAKHAVCVCLNAAKRPGSPKCAGYTRTPCFWLYARVLAVLELRQPSKNKAVGTPFFFSYFHVLQ